ncbi:MAG: cah [Acidimicrobiaceae bacterium]|nr:cah [Acidimicrobiaceae bacterium]
MPSVDLALEELRDYRPRTAPPDGFDEFWDSTLIEATKAPLAIALEERGPRLKGVEVYALSFEGFGGGRVTGWYVRPSGDGPFPGVVSYHGYTGRGARALDSYPLAAQGVAVISMDCRGQSGDAPGISSTTGHTQGWLTQGLDSPENHYYRTVYGDAVRAAEALCSLPEVDLERIAFTGASQGGGLTLAAAALSTRPAFAWADVPFLCDFPRAVQVATEDPYLEIPRLLRLRPDLEELTFDTLRYIDVANLAPRVTCPTVVTVGLWDNVCPPSTIFGAFSRLSSKDKDLRVYPFSGHVLPYEAVEDRYVTLLDRLGLTD